MRDEAGEEDWNPKKIQWFTIWILCLTTDLDIGFVREGSKKMPELVNMVEWQMADTTHKK